MTNTSLLTAMIDRYNDLSYTHNYIFGFSFKGVIYMVATTESVLPYVMKLDKASRGQGYSIRFSPTTEQKIALMSYGATALCSTAFFKDYANNSKYNKGEIFEKLVTEYYGQEWEKDNVPFAKGPDVVINHVAYQIKFEKATFTNEKFLASH